jgi:ferredoxin
MKIHIDSTTCTGHGRCYSLAPQLFDSDEFGHGVVLGGDVPDDLLDAARSAVENCPERAISLQAERT